MSDTQTTPAKSGEFSGVRLISHYIKDLSVENPGAPFSVRIYDGNYVPSLRIEVSASALQEGLHECEISMTARVQRDGADVVVIEMVYGGAYNIGMIPAEFAESFLLVDAPRELFPYMRMLVAMLTHAAGLPALHIEHPDFNGMYWRTKQPAAGAYSPDTSTPQS
jgi:preprotein translocase subunit SecB